MLKTNSIQGVLVFGSREKRVAWEAEELIAALTRTSFEPRFGVESFSALGSVAPLGLQGVEEFIVYYLRACCQYRNLHGKGHFAGNLGSLSY
jgi:hypothetical protein